MEMRIIAQGLNDPPQLEDLKSPIVNLSSIDKMTCCVVEGGMVSGEPSVLIIVEQPRGGSVIVQTSLDKFLAAAQGMASMAQSRWGWKQADGAFTLLPMEKETRKHLLEKIKQELEEYD